MEQTYFLITLNTETPITKEDKEFVAKIFSKKLKNTLFEEKFKNSIATITFSEDSITI